MGLLQASVGYRGSRGGRRTPGHHARTGTLRDAVAAMLQLPSLAGGGVCVHGQGTPRADCEARVPVAPSMPEQPQVLASGPSRGLGKDPPLQVEKGMFPPWWVRRSGAPAAVLLQGLPCISVVTPVLGPGPDAADGHKE